MLLAVCHPCRLFVRALFVFLLGITSVAADESQTVPIHVDLTTLTGKQPQFRQGDLITVYISLDQPAYLLVLYRDVAGHLLQVLPNRLQSSSRFPADDFIAFPGSHSDFQLRVRPPFGRERLWVLATEKPMPDLPGEWLEAGVKQIPRSLEWVVKTVANNSGGGFGQAELGIVTRPR